MIALCSGGFETSVPEMETGDTRSGFIGRSGGYATCRMPWFEMEHSENTRTCGRPAVRHKFDLIVVRSVHLYCVKQNACDELKPRGFRLPQIERLRDSVLLGGGGALYGKIGPVQLFLESALA